MSGEVWQLVGVSCAGGAGAVLRYLVDIAVSTRWKGTFPWGIMAVNLSGSLTLGVLLGVSASSAVMLVLGTGFLGGYTTLSTTSLDTVMLLTQRRWSAALGNALGMLLGSVGLALFGIWFGAALRAALG